MNGATLASVLNLVKNELKHSLSVGTSDDPALKQAIETKQEWLAGQYTFQILDDEWSANVVAGGRYTDFPVADIAGNACAINFDHPVQAYVKWNSTYQEICKGVSLEDYNAQDPDDNECLDPIQKWRIMPGNTAKFEVWPKTVEAQVVRFEGQRKLKTLRNAGVLDTTKTLDLDDQLVAYAVAVDWLAGKPAQAAKIALFETRLTKVRDGDQSSDQRCIIGGGNQDRERIRRAKLVIVA